MTDPDDRLAPGSGVGPAADPTSGQYPPGYGQYPPGHGHYPPPGYGQYPPGYGQVPPSGGQYPPPPYGRPQINRHIGWLVVSWIFLWPLGLYSLLSAFLNVDRALAVGDIAGARYHADRIRKHGMIALGVGVVWLVIVFAVFIAVGTTATSVHACFGANSC